MTHRKQIEWINPLVEHRADPYVLLHQDGYYYFIATVPEYNRIELRRALELNQLKEAEPVVIWKEHEIGEMKYHIWAPELHYIDGAWYIYFAAAHSEDHWRIRMYVLRNTQLNPLEGEWEEKGQIKSLWESFSLDGTTFEHQGKQYYIWAQNDPKIGGNTNLYIDEMINPWTLAGKQVLLTKPEFDWECIGFLVNEGPAVLKTKEKIYLSYSASKTDFNYCMGLLEISVKDSVMDVTKWKKHT
ncbi:MAG: family 43 glycosylhydrolase, partial [Vallitaleaceae bacterium]|nr:family 43 glycosylhydrolase [Vallitaleaceae bacterium]